MSYCKECPYCGANLDPGERCSCREEKAEEKEQVVKISYQAREKQNVG